MTRNPARGASAPVRVGGPLHPSPYLGIPKQPRPPGEIVTLMPLSGSLSASTVPPCASTISWTIASPNPSLRVLAARPLRAVEAVEKPGQMLGGDSASRIGYPDPDPVLPLARPLAGRGPRPGCAGSRYQQVAQTCAMRSSSPMKKSPSARGSREQFRVPRPLGETGGCSARRGRRRSPARGASGVDRCRFGRA